MFSLERVARNASISHFLLMFGYKLFSFFFPLFLLERGFSLPQVGYAYLFLYLPIALFAPVVGYLNHRWNPAVLASLGIVGYGVYALLMMTLKDAMHLLAAQVLLGIAAALFFASLRSVLIGSNLQNPNRAFGWFYSAPLYAEALAPALGALIIWQSGFFGVFLLSFLIYGFNAGFTFFSLRKATSALIDNDAGQKILFQYRQVLNILRQKLLFPFLLVSLSMLVVGGFYRAFFILFLKDLSWTQNVILLYGALFSILFVPISLLVIHFVSKQQSSYSVLYGGIIFGVSSMAFGLIGVGLHFLSVLSLMLVRSAGGLLGNTARSALVTKHTFQYPEEAGALDTVFSPFGIALGSLFGGLLIALFSYSTIFFLTGVIVTVLTLFVLIAKRRNFR